MRKPEISVIISTYNAKEWLKKVLEGYLYQTYTNFEIVIADDGSDDNTKKLIERISSQSSLVIKHVWHEDKGFRKTIILNKAIEAATANYLVFTDGDCIPRADFLATHIKHREKGYFLSGGYLKLTMATSKKINFENIKNQECFDINWLLKNHHLKSFKNNKITALGKKATLLNYFTPTKATWNGHNASGWKSDIVNVNGFDERMQYGGEDRELGERLFNLGIKSKQIRYSAICIHLDHARGYVKPEMIEKNKQIRYETKQNKSKTTPYGINKT